MARKRMIDPEFWSDQEIGQWSHSARLLYIGLWNFADDCGRFKADPGLIKSQIFPYDPQKSLKFGKTWLQVSKKLVLYEVKGLKYGYIPNFNKYQRIDKPSPSKLPPPPDHKFDESSGRTQESFDPKLIEEKLREEKISKDKGIQVNLENILATMDVDIKNLKSIGTSEYWIKTNYMNLGIPEDQINKALGIKF